MPTKPYPQEPDRNEPCLCGSGRKFKRCCARLYRDAPGDSGWRIAYREGDFQRALELLRPVMCRYAIWHRSHTVPWLERDPEAAEWILAIDILALGDYLSSLQDCYDAAGTRSEFPGVLDRLASLVDDRRWGHQIVLQRTYWVLGPDWDRNKGKETLADLDLGEVTDPEILTVFLDVHSNELSAAETLDLCDRILDLSDEPSYQLHYSVLKGVLWIFLGEHETGLSAIEAALNATRGEVLEAGWGQDARIGALHILGVHRDDETLIAEARSLCQTALTSDMWTDRGRARLLQILGDISVSRGEHAAAVGEYRASRELDDTHPVTISLARCYMALQDVNRANEMLAVLATAELNEGEHVDYVLARAGLLLLPHEESLRVALRSDLEALEPSFPIHREARDKLIQYITELTVEDSHFMARVKRAWESIGTYVILQPTFLGVGVDLKKLGDTLLGVSPADANLLEAPDADVDAEEPA